MSDHNEQTHTPPSTILVASHDRVQLCSLVLSAKGIKHRLIPDEGGNSRLEVEPEDFESAVYQLDRYFEENRNWPPPPAPTQAQTFPAFLPTMLLIGALLLLFYHTGPWQSESYWFRAGANDNNALFERGEWYRLVTALTLHADLSHLLGNCLFGGFLVFHFFQLQGYGLGLSALVTSAAFGNYLNSMIQQNDHLSIGFSTAVFSVIGMLAATSTIRSGQWFSLRSLIPLMAGVGLLAMLGSSGVRTDIGAHLFGLISGILVGIIINLKQIIPIRNSSFAQSILFIIATLLIIGCWSEALQGV
ncbi:MAG: rhomboid family intramembrane serine protease [Desulfobulbaceae bacterium]|nr:MAG: rhomboid family intramembrane serine protease [Desulfobulbaceae bacterium]